MSVATLLAAANAVDSDKGTALGLALTSASGPGTWQYRLSGAAWQAVPATVSGGAALLLPRSALLRFQPAGNQAGTTATLSWLAWDQTQGTAGAAGFNITGTGGTGGASAFSAAAATAVLAVTTRPKAAPAWSGSRAALTPVTPGALQPPGDTVGSIFGALFEDLGKPVGIAVAALAGAGTWEYSLDGTKWQPIGGVSAGKALLLSASDWLRFVPKAGYLGTAKLSAYAWDGSGSSNAGTFVNLGGQTGGTGAFSAKPLTATRLVNTAPTLSP